MGGSQSNNLTPAQLTSQSLVYAIPIPGQQKKQGETEVYYNPKAGKNFIITQPEEDIASLQDQVLKNKDKFKDIDHLGSLDKEKKKFNYITYSQSFTESVQIANGLFNLNLLKFVSDYKWKFNLIGVFANNSKEWYIIDQGSALYNYAVIPIYSTLGPENIPAILEETTMNTLVVDQSSIKVLLKITNQKFHDLKNLILIGDIEQNLQDQLKQLGFNLYTYNDVLESGKTSEPPREFPKIQPEDVFTFSYTSGTTGNPKGAVIAQRSMISLVTSGKNIGIPCGVGDLHFSYLPLPHTYERSLVWQLSYFGGTICFSSGDKTKLVEELQICRPTVFISVPRVFNKIYDNINNKINQLSAVKRWVAKKAIETKLYNLKQNNSFHHAIYDRLIFRSIQSQFGGRIRCMITGAAPISGEVLNFLKIAMSCQFHLGYGSTEGCSQNTLAHINDIETDHIGGVLVHLNFKLIDIPEIEYFTDHKDENGQPLPQGELCFKGPSIFMGYYKNQEQTDEVLEKDGWLHTGDVCQMKPNGQLKIIDRKKNIFKLQQGEYVAPDKVESVYARAPGVEEIFVYGNSYKAYLVGIIFPNQKYVENLGKQLNLDLPFEKLCKEKQIRVQIQNNMIQKGKEFKLFGFEQIKNLHIDTKSFMDTGVCNHMMKIKRNFASHYYKDTIEKLYEEYKQELVAQNQEIGIDH